MCSLHWTTLELWSFSQNLCIETTELNTTRTLATSGTAVYHPVPLHYIRKNWSGNYWSGVGWRWDGKGCLLHIIIYHHIIKNTLVSKFVSFSGFRQLSDQVILLLYSRSRWGNCGKHHSAHCMDNIICPFLYNTSPKRQDFHSDIIFSMLSYYVLKYQLNVAPAGIADTHFFGYITRQWGQSHICIS